MLKLDDDQQLDQVADGVCVCQGKGEVVLLREGCTRSLMRNASIISLCSTCSMTETRYAG